MATALVEYFLSFQTSFTVVPDTMQRPHAVLPADFLPLLVAPRVIGNRHFMYRDSLFRNLRRNLRLETEPFLLYVDGLDDFPLERKNLI